MPAPDTTPYIPRRYPREGTLVVLLPAEPGDTLYYCRSISERRHMLDSRKPSDWVLGEALPGTVIHYTEAATDEEAERLEGIVRMHGFYNPVRKRHFTQALRRRLGWNRRNRDAALNAITAEQMAEEGLTK